MNWIKNMFTFFKNKHKKGDDIKYLNEAEETVIIDDRVRFIDSLKENVVKKKKKVETLTCVGDGLGIQNTITY